MVFVSFYYKTTAKLNLASEILLSTLTLGGAGLGLYGIFKRRGINHVGENLGLLDQVVFEGSFDRAFKNPLQTVKKLIHPTLKNADNFLQKNVFKPLQSTAKSIKSKISASIAKGKKAFQNKIGKPVLSTAKKVIKSVAHKTAPLIKTMKQVSNRIQSKLIKPIQNTTTKKTAKSTPTITRAVVNTIAKPINKVTTVVQRTIVKPIARVTKAVAKPIVRAIARAVPKPITRAVTKVAQVFRPQPSAKKGRKRR